MDKQQEIVQMLWDESYQSKPMRCSFVRSDDFEELAERIVRIFEEEDVCKKCGSKSLSASKRLCYGCKTN